MQFILFGCFFFLGGGGKCEKNMEKRGNTACSATAGLGSKGLRYKRAWEACIELPGGLTEVYITYFKIKADVFTDYKFLKSLHTLLNLET